jgi:hypothetical protein
MVLVIAGFIKNVYQYQQTDRQAYRQPENIDERERFVS